MAIKSLITAILIVACFSGCGQPHGKIELLIDTSAKIGPIQFDVLSESRNIVVCDSFGTRLLQWEEGQSMVIGDTVKLIKQLLLMLNECNHDRKDHTPSYFKQSNYTEEDTLTAERFIEDSIGNGYEIEYRYVGNHDLGVDSSGERGFHQHYISLVSIIAFRGNKKKTIASNIKSIYSPVECVSDNRELWLKRLYQILNNKK